MKSSKLLRFPLVTVTTSLILALLSPASRAATVGLLANDAAGSTSFNTAGHWSNGQTPSGTNDYNTSGFQLRSPGDANSYTFAGESLTFSNNSLAGSGNGSFLDKYGGGSGTSRTLTMNNLTNLGGALVRSGAANGTIVHIAGNHYTIAGGSELRADQTTWIIDSPLLGADNIIFTNHYSNNNPPNHISYTANNSGFTGSWYIFGDGANASCYVELQSASSQPANPSTFNPAQITLGPNGILLDTAGTTFANPNGGFTLLGAGVIDSPSTTVIGEPITGGFSLTETGGGTLVLSNANNTYSGGTIISAGTLKMGVVNALPVGTVTVTGELDLNGNNTTVDGLTGAGTVETIAGGNPTLTIGAAGGSATFSGTIQNGSGILNVLKAGAGTETFSTGYGYTGATTVAGGTLNLLTSQSLPSTAGDVIVSNGAVLAVNTAAATDVPLPMNNFLLGTNSTLNIALVPTNNGINAAAGLTFQDNATNNFIYGTLTANPTAPGINAAGSISAPGSNIVINVSALGLNPGTFSLIKYTGTALSSIANFSLIAPPGVAAELVNNQANDSIDINITSTPNQLSWNGVAGESWDLTTPNWSNTISGGITVFQQYTNNGIVAGDSVLFDDTLTNTSPQPTNVNITGAFFAFPVVENSTLPYSLSGPGGILGPTSLVKSNSGSWTLLNSNSYAGGTFVYGGTLVVGSDGSLGTNTGPVTLGGGNLQYLGSSTNNVRPFTLSVPSYIAVPANNTVQLGGTISGAGGLQKEDNGTLVLAGKTTLPSGSTGDLFVKFGIVTIPTGASVTNGYYDDVAQDTNDVATLNISGGSLTTLSDFNVGDLGNSQGTLNITSGSLTANAFFVGSANLAGSTASGTVNQSGGTVTELNNGVGEFVIGGRTSTSGVGVYNMTGGTLNSSAGLLVGRNGTGTFNQSGGTVNAVQGMNIARLGLSFGTNNLNGGILNAFNVGSSTGSNAIFNFNGGTLRAAFTNATPWVANLTQMNVLAGGAIIDDGGGTPIFAQSLTSGNSTGGLTKQGSGTLTMTVSNNFTGPITNNAGTLFLDSASTYPGAVQINAGTLQITPATVLNGSIAIKTNATLAVIQTGSSTVSMGNLTFNGQTALPGAELTVTLSSSNVGAVPFINAGTLTLNGTNTINVSGNVPLGATALLQYTGAIVGSGTLTNLVLPQGASGYLSNNTAGSTLYVVVTNAGPGLVWTGTNSAAGRTNVWDILSTTNWLVNGKPTWYQQFGIPGDAVTFNDSGSGTVLLSNTVAPANVVITNNAKVYTFSGTGSISGPTGVTKFGTNTAIINLTNSYTGNTTISNGTLQTGIPAALSANGNLVIGPAGTLEVNGQSQTVGELTGSGVVDDKAADTSLAVGTASGGTWSGTIQDQGLGGVALIKNGSGTWVIAGTNHLGNGSSFQFQAQFDGGTTIITNSGSILMPVLEMQIASGVNATATVVVAGGTLVVQTNLLTIGLNTNASGTLVVNSGTVYHGGGTENVFNVANSIIVGGANASGSLIVNGGQVLNTTALTIAQGSSSTGSFFLNGGLVQATVVQTGNSANATNFFNGGTLQATESNADFIQVPSMVMSNGLVLDDGGFPVSILSQALQAGDTFNGGLLKKGAGTLYLDSANSYAGTTLVTNGSLAGVGSILGPLVVAPGGNLGAGDAANIGQFTVNNNSVTLQGTATFRISVTGNLPQSDEILGVSTANYGGTLVISNITTDSSVLTNGQTFQLFGATTGSGNFAHIVGSPGAGLSYVFYPSTGVLGVTNAVVKSVPQFTHISVSGTTLNISGTNGTPSSPYVLLGSTNVALPLAQWSPLLTNTFGSDGSFNMSTNIVNIGVPHEFYILSQ